MADPVSALCDIFVQGVILMEKHGHTLRDSADVWRGPWAKFRREVDRAAGIDAATAAAVQPARAVDDESVVFARKATRQRGLPTTAAAPPAPAAARRRAAPVSDEETAAGCPAPEVDGDVDFVFDDDSSVDEEDAAAIAAPPVRPTRRAAPPAHKPRAQPTVARTVAPSPMPHAIPAVPEVEVACEAAPVMAGGLQPVGFTPLEDMLDVPKSRAAAKKPKTKRATAKPKAPVEADYSPVGGADDVLFPKAKKFGARKAGAGKVKKTLVMRSDDEAEADDLARELRAPSPEVQPPQPVTRRNLDMQPHVQGGRMEHTYNWVGALPARAPPRLSDATIATTTFPHKYPATPSFFIEGYVCKEPQAAEQAAMYQKTLATLRREIGPVDDDSDDEE